MMAVNGLLEDWTELIRMSGAFNRGAAGLNNWRNKLMQPVLILTGNSRAVQNELAPISILVYVGNLLRLSSTGLTSYGVFSTIN